VLDVRFPQKTTKLLRGSEMTRSANGLMRAAPIPGTHMPVNEPSTHQKLTQAMVAMGGLRSVFYMAPGGPLPSELHSALKASK